MLLANTFPSGVLLMVLANMELHGKTMPSTRAANRRPQFAQPKLLHPWPTWLTLRLKQTHRAGPNSGSDEQAFALRLPAN